MQRHENGESLAKAMNLDAGKLKATFEKYNQDAKSGKDSFGKNNF